MRCAIVQSLQAGRPSASTFIDCDLGKSGANAIARDGFQELVSEVALAKRASSWASKSPDWRATQPIGIGFSSYARWPPPLFSTRMASTTQPASTTGRCSGSKAR